MAYIFVCTPTSGTASMLRIIQAIAGPELRMKAANGPASLQKGEGVTFLDAKANNVLYWFRGPRHWDATLNVSDFRMIAHFRDPRDLACNQYWWALQHPNTHDTPEVAEQKRRKTEEMGIDHYVLGRNNTASYGMLGGLSDGPQGDAVTWTSYNQLCCAFDYMVDNLCRTFNRAPSAVAEALRAERPENLFANPEWVKVGGTWKGADVTPGRFRRDLKPETVEAITKRHEAELAFCRYRDAPFLSHHYT
ncbi:hypothetical protein SAMN02745194_00068 [Roseomonas rosea]|uniref:Sulfotransferase family protein n=1 Tax=Muricoccus roseus TaxID=198092 RepID=A0A1M6ABR7_9PROT|nr:hypothetical protein [Roseomonas rosea]SHI33932.1 hypothetical protein SAMN02745194_00068 [Roseomonas rosea]